MELLEEFYNVTIDGEEEVIPKGKILGLAITKLELSDLDGGVNTYNYETVIESWTSATPVPSEETLIASGITEVEAIKAKQYQNDRVYPSIQEQLDMQYWDSVNGTTTWADAIAAVKAANPKPE